MPREQLGRGWATGVCAGPMLVASYQQRRLSGTLYAFCIRLVMILHGYFVNRVDIVLD